MVAAGGDVGIGVSFGPGVGEGVTVGVCVGTFVAVDVAIGSTWQAVKLKPNNRIRMITALFKNLFIT